VVVKDAKAIPAGLFPAWQREERVWLELAPADFERPFFLSPKLARGLGEQWLYGGLMLPGPRLVQWRRVHNTVQLMALNTRQIAAEGTPEARAVAAAVSPSLLASVPVLSQPHPERKTVLIDASSVFVSDMLGLAGQLQRTYRQGYGLEPRNSLITAVRGRPDLTVLEVTAHYATGSITMLPPGAPAGMPMPSVPGGLADPRSMLLGLHYSLARLPAQPMPRRMADARLGHFVSTVDDFSNDLPRSPRQRFVQRWRLEKQDPAAELSPPVKPITFWIDRNVPVKYREAIRDGILEWNKAFERIGFQNAIVVQQQPEDADWDTLDADRASVRWMADRDIAFGAIGPSHVDPRTGEILDADIGIESLSARSIRHLRARLVPPPATASARYAAGATSPGDAETDWPALLQLPQAAGRDHGAPGLAGGHAHDALGRCLHADQAAEQLGYALDLQALRDGLAPDSAEAQTFVLAYLKDTTMHEVGHTLGLRHNFRASKAFTDRQVSDPEFTRTQAFTGSVMEYAPINLPRPGEAAPAPFLTTLGPYDYWAIEYAYKPIAPAEEATELTRLAARSGEAELAFATDEDSLIGVDPDALFFDLGDDPLAFAERRFDIAADLFRRQEARQLGPDEDYAALRRSLLYAARDAGRATGIVLRQIGGLRTLRDRANTGRDPLQPVPLARQRAALDLIGRRVLAADAFVISPSLKRRLAPDYLERAESLAGTPTDFSLPEAVFELQRTVLGQLMSDGLARRVIDNAGRATGADEAFTLDELYRRVHQTVWSELTPARGGVLRPIEPARRELQRDHVNRLAVLSMVPMANSRADARGLAREQARSLLAELQQALRRPGGTADTRRHLQDSAESLRLALGARLQRMTP